MIYVYGEYYVVVIYHTKLKVFLDFHPFFTATGKTYPGQHPDFLRLLSF